MEYGGLERALQLCRSALDPESSRKLLLELAQGCQCLTSDSPRVLCAMVHAGVSEGVACAAFSACIMLVLRYFASIITVSLEVASCRRSAIHSSQVEPIQQQSDREREAQLNHEPGNSNSA